MVFQPNQQKYDKKNNFFVLFSRPIVYVNWTYQARGIQLSARLCASEVVKVPPFADSVSEGDVR